MHGKNEINQKRKEADLVRADEKEHSSPMFDIDDRRKRNSTTI